MFSPTDYIKWKNHQNGLDISPYTAPLAHLNELPRLYINTNHID